MIVTIIGIGLIGGSIGITLKESGFASKVIGVDRSQENLDKAIRRRLIDEDMGLESAVAASDILILSVPVNAMLEILPKLLDLVKDQVIMDVGSTKFQLMEAVKNHPNRKQFVGSHPMAGTEYSGPEAAIPNLFDYKTTVICDKELSSSEAVAKIESLYKALKMNVIYMDSKSHDVHTAYISHISHISSFALALTVLEKEKDEQAIFDLAGGGFSSTVRLAKSSAEMWVPVFQQNRDNVLDVLDEHINSLSKFRTLLIKKDFQKINELIEQSNEIKRILN